MTQTAFKRMFQEVDRGFPLATTAKLHNIDESTLRRWYKMGLKEALAYKFVKCDLCNKTTFRESHNHTYCNKCHNLKPKPTKQEKRERKLQEIRETIDNYFKKQLS